MNSIDAQAHEALLSVRRTLQRFFEDKRVQERQLQEEVEPDWPDRALSRENPVSLKQLSDAERRELAEIDAALERIASGTFGRCAGCGGAIGRQRLRAIPEAQHCIVCSEQLERSRQ